MGVMADKRAAVAEALKALSAEQRQAMIADRGFVLTIEGHPLSVNNTIAARLQCDGATVVGGFQQWLRAGRCVRKGESCIVLFRPASRKADPERQDGEMSSQDDRTRFVVYAAFDITQTEELTEEAKAAHKARARTVAEPEDDGAEVITGRRGAYRVSMFEESAT